MDKYVQLKLLFILLTLIPTDGYITEDVLGTFTQDEQELIQQYREKYWDMPDECRKDLCESDVTYIPDRLGSIKWPTTQVGYRVHIPCPWGSPITNHKGVQRDCRLSTNNTMWGEKLWGTTLCDDPPTSRYLKATTAVLMTLGRKELFASVSHLAGECRLIPDGPILKGDILKYVFILNTLVRISKGTSLKHDVTSFSEDMLYVSNWLTRSKYASQATFRRLSNVIIKMSLVLANSSSAYPMMLYGKDISVYIRVPAGTSVDHDKVIIHSHDNEDEVITLALFKKEYFLTKYATASSLSKFPWMIDDPDWPTDSQIMGTNETKPPSLHVTTMTSSSNKSAGFVPLVPGKNSVTKRPSINNTRPTYIADLKEIEPPIVFVHRHQGMDNLSLSITFNISGAHITDHLAVCVHRRFPLPIKDEKELKWDGDSCDTEVFHTKVVCSCKGHGLFAVLTHIKVEPYVIEWIATEAATLDVLLVNIVLIGVEGFPFRFELYITSHVLRAISLVCLIVTVITYTLLRVRSRRSTPTNILLHLCFSLVFLLVILYISEPLVGSKVGCHVANALRLYAIMVSLAWNGVEAVNMYLMLIKVFNSKISHFVTKAAVICWGVPAIVITAAALIERKTFAGIYVNCIFRCQLHHNTLYYGFLLPMCLVIAHNIIVFSLVVRVLIGSNRTPGAGGFGRSQFMQLIGAVAMLVLLGVPWIFSVWGAVEDERLSTVEGIFQVIFVVFINLQGIFIFLFHCARIEDVRKQWKSLVTTSGSVSFKHSTTKTNGNTASALVSTQITTAV